MYPVSDLTRKLEKLNIHLSDMQTKQMIQFYEILIEKNQVMNLTAITDFDDVVDKHFVDSLSLVNAVDREILLSPETSLIDVGTGAGFPGIPLKIAFPELRVTLLDSLNKRVSFLSNVSQSLQLKEISIYHGRAEDYGKMTAHRENYHLCVSRAVAYLPTLAEYCMPFVMVGGQFIAYKSGKAEKEIQAAERAVGILGGEIEKKLSFRLPDTDIERTLVVIKKISPTPAMYPRKAGKPEREPLK